MKKIFNNSKRGMAVILTLCILIGIAGTCVHAAVVDETTQVADEPTQELMPMMANGCSSVPQRAYDMYSYITSGNDPSIYRHHEYENTSSPYLPKNTTYTTYYMAGSARLVIGANGSAYYSPNHYASWINMY